MSQWNGKNEALKCLTCFSLKIYPSIYFLWFSAGLLLPQPILFKIQLLVVTIFGLVLRMLMRAEITGSWSKGDWPTDAKKPGLAGQRAVSGSRWGALESSRVGIRMDLRRSTWRWNQGRSDAIWARDLHQEPCQEMMAWDTGLVEWGLPCGSVVKYLPANAADASSIPGLGRSPGEGNGDPLQYSHLGNPMDRGAWWATGHGISGVRHDLATITITTTSPLKHRHWQDSGT